MRGPGPTRPLGQRGPSAPTLGEGPPRGGGAGTFMSARTAGVCWLTAPRPRQPRRHGGMERSSSGDTPRAVAAKQSMAALSPPSRTPRSVCHTSCPGACADGRAHLLPASAPRARLAAGGFSLPMARRSGHSAPTACSCLAVPHGSTSRSHHRAARRWAPRPSDSPANGTTRRSR